MERYEARDNETVEELISIAERGVEVELTRDGRVVARVVPTADAEPTAAQQQATRDWLDDLKSIRGSLPPEVLKLDWQATLQEVRQGWDL